MAQLKISDLSVGDWVGIDQAELNMPSDDLATAYIEKLRKPIRIKGISEDSDMVIADIEIVDEWGSIMMKCEHLRPIPITPEILEKNGFVKWQGGLVLIGDDISCRYEDDNLTIEQGYRDNDGVLVERLLVNIECKAVHQLQHALRLAGVKKEIKL